MHRSDGTNLAVGALLVGISAVILGLLSPLAAGIVAAICGVAGLYMIVGGVYVGLPTPATVVERAFRPRLTDAEAEVTQILRDGLVFQISVVNRGRDDVRDGLVNVTVPEDVQELKRSTTAGEVNNPEHKGSFWDQPEKFWKIGRASCRERV